MDERYIQPDTTRDTTSGEREGVWPATVWSAGGVPGRELRMRVSARNHFVGLVQARSRGAINTEVLLSLDGGEYLTATVTNRAAEHLGITLGQQCHALFKASSVLVGTGEARLSVRNVYCGTVVDLQRGPVNAELTLRTAGGLELTAMLTAAAVDSLGMAVGVEAFALVKASAVILAVE
ncbi:TOBE domain-containing protein [Plasticicumulans acidivorans]|uniref:Molybdate transport system regulatory protein n=1 Tax=Plasticicumulans acidivorans TaxID=886464 RepID=A0A317MQZ3_9GAMM|nr:TOBE domain-containing protein [Plasticicumulans acidivorans]PWV58615.1 molybdate transport system regulatory protein [Plasticicumulans acidivorans]